MNKGDALCDVSEMLGTNVPMKFIGGSYTYFRYHTVDEDLASISDLKHGSPKVWYVCPAAHMRKFEIFCFEHIFNMDYLNDFNEGVRQFFPEKNFVQFSTS